MLYPLVKCRIKKYVTVRMYNESTRGYNMSEIFNKISKEAKKRGLSIADVAKKSQITNASLYAWNKNDENIKAKNVYNVAKTLNVSPAYLLGWTPENTNSAQTTELTAIKNTDISYKDVPLTEKELRAFCAMIEELRN